MTAMPSPLGFLASGATSLSGFRADCPGEQETLKDGERKSEDQSSTV